MNDLQVYVDQKDIAEVFTEGGANDILDKIEAEARSLVPDVTTAKGRKQIASTANHVARSKTYLDGLGKELSAGLRKQVSAIDHERRTIRHRLDNLKRDVRDPLTIYETKEKIRIEEIKAVINKFERPVPRDINTIKVRIDRIESIEIDESFGEFKDEARAAKEASLNRLRLAESEIEQASAREQLEKKQRDLEDAIRKIEQMKEAAARAEREAKEAAARAEREAKEAAAKAEREAKEAAAKAEREAKEAAAKAEREAEEAEARKKAEEAERAAHAEREAKEAKAKAEAEAAEMEAKAKEAAARKKAEEAKAEEAKARAEREAKEAAARAKANADASRSKASASLVRLCSLNALKAGEILDKIESGEIQGVSCEWSSK